jgi:hypothetical protein
MHGDPVDESAAVVDVVSSLVVDVLVVSSLVVEFDVVAVIEVDKVVADSLVSEVDAESTLESAPPPSSPHASVVAMHKSPKVET